VKKQTQKYSSEFKPEVVALVITVGYCVPKADGSVWSCHHSRY